MRLTPYSYTNALNTGADTTINDFPTTWYSTVKLRPIVTDGAAQYADAGDGQEPKLTGVKLAGSILEITFVYNGTTRGDGYDLLAALFDKRDKTEKTFTLRDLDDLVVGVGRSYYVTCRNIGVSKPINRTMVARVALVSELLLTTSSTTESTWTNAATGTKAITIDKGNIEALPVFSISPTAASTTGPKYRRPIVTFNYTQKAAPGYHIEVTNGGLDTAALINYTAIKLQINGAINSSVTAIAYDNPTGTMPSSFPYSIYVESEQMKVTGRTGTSSGTLTVVRGVNGSSQASHADNLFMALSKMAYDGRDLRIYTGDGNGNAIETPYWFGGVTGATGGMNTAATKIWIQLSYAVCAIGYLGASITDVETSLTIYPTGTPNGLGAQGDFDTTDGLLLIGDVGTAEIIAYSDFVPSTGAATTLVRGVKGSTAIAHNINDRVRAIREIWMYYGDAAPTTPTYNTALSYLQLKPPFDLTSTNDAWTYSTFGNALNGYNVGDEWKSAANDLQNIYTSTATGSAPIVMPSPQVNPFTEIGISVLYAGGYGLWWLAVPFGCTSAVASTVYRLNLPANMAYLMGTALGVNVGNQAIAAQGVTWSSTATVTLTPSSSADKVQLYLKNTQTAALARRAAVQIASCVININGSTDDSQWGRPYIYLGAEVPTTVTMDVTIASTTTAESLRLKMPDIAIGSSLIVNCLAKTIRYSLDNRPAFSSLQRYAPRDEWMRLLQGSNTLSFTNNDGSATVYDVVVTWQGRNNTFG